MIINLETDKKRKPTKLDPHDLEIETKHFLKLFRTQARGLELKEPIEQFIDTQTARYMYYMDLSDYKVDYFYYF
jgi:hypothetical protein